jgi:hypothetical protein
MRQILTGIKNRLPAKLQGGDKVGTTYDKVKWKNNADGAFIEGMCDVLDFFDELVTSFPGVTLAGNGNEIVHEFLIGGKKAELKFHHSTNAQPGTATISLTSNGFTIKFRFKDC